MDSVELGKFVYGSRTVQSEMTLRYYYSLNPVYFDEPTRFWGGKFNQSFREGSVTFEEVIEDLMKEGGSNEDRVPWEIVSQKLIEATTNGLIPKAESLFQEIQNQEASKIRHISFQEKDKKRDYRKLVESKKWTTTIR